jgi:hypothetical protein
MVPRVFEGSRADHTVKAISRTASAPHVFKQSQECNMLMNARKAMMAAAVALTAGAVGFTGTAPSYAGAINSAPVQKSGFQSGAPLVQVDFRKDRMGLDRKGKKYKKYNKKRWSWNRHHHGKRYRYKRPGFAYYYGGYWYPRPYWRSEPGIYLHFDL